MDFIKEQNMEWIPTLIKGIGAALAMLWANTPIVVQVLLIMQAVDIVSGVLVAGSNGELNSKVSFKGITKKALVQLIVVMAAVLEQYLAPSIPIPLVEAVAGFYVAHESISILENAVRSGLPVPQVLQDTIKKISNKDQATTPPNPPK
ncbi:hypothetical protein GC175_17005 [bacterium]|nr:hypothetical protein [bacterium]